MSTSGGSARPVGIHPRGARVVSTSDADVAHAVAVLKRGGVIAIPTDTVYGIAALPDCSQAVERIFAIKGRPETKPIPILVDGLEQLRRCSSGASALAERLARAFWPGALTIVVPAASWIPRVVLRGETSVGLRMPASEVALQLISACGGALAVTSANRSGEPEARSAVEAARKLGDDLDLIVDGGPSPLARASTVVDALGVAPVVLRAGAISEAELSAALGDPL